MSILGTLLSLKELSGSSCTRYRCKMKHVLQILFYLMSLNVAINGDWVDPHSMDTATKHKIKTSLNKEEKENNLNMQSTCNQDSGLYLRRIVRLMLSNAHLESDTSGVLSGHINIILSANDHKYLQEFSKSDSDNSFNKVGAIFEAAFQKTSFEKFQEMFLSFQEQVYLMIFNPTSASLAAVSLALYVTYKLLRANFTYWTIMKYFICLLYLFDFVINYLRIIQEEEIDNLVTVKKLGLTPPECNPQNMDWWTYVKTTIKSTVSENPCKAYYYAAAYDRFKYLVAPGKVFTYQFKEIIVEPLSHLGEAVGKFGRSMFTALPWGLNIVIFPIMLITFCVILCIIFVFATRTPVKIGVFHLFHIELGQNEERRILNAVQEGNIREQIDMRQHRRMVEDVHEPANQEIKEAVHEPANQEIEETEAGNEAEDLKERNERKPSE